MTAVASPPYGTAPRPRNHGDRTDVIVRAAHLLRVRPTTVRDWISGHHQLLPRLEALVEVLLAAGDRARVERMFRRLDALRRGITEPVLSHALILQEKTADADEDVSLARYLCHPCAETAGPLVRDLDTQMTLDLEFRAALVAAHPALRGT